MTKSGCKAIEAKLAELLLEPESVPAELQAHLDGCSNCRSQLEGLRDTMALLDEWQAPEPNPYFMTRLNARLDEERQTAPASWLERLRARLVYGSTQSVRPLAAMAMTVLLLVGGGAYISVTDQDRTAPQAGAQVYVVSDLETLDSNAQLLDALEMITDNANDNAE